ncbi:hypothetical protein [Rossellomorea aquimaris]|uniref:hypothetical protein n=1 Tax=Rossellomorea aquimaris TaxID=189382 RepID=UPI0005C85F3D|nr:hypothetical protein [Rossellomorea aquimaris]
MKGEQFDSKMKELFQDEPLPSSVKKRIEDTYDMIETESRKNRHFFLLPLRKGIKAALIGGGLVTVSTFGVLASQGFQLFDSNGEVVMELTQPDSDIQEWDAGAADSFKEKVKPGEALIYYQVSDYPEKNFTVYRQPRRFSDYETYRESIQHSYMPSETLPFGFRFESGKLTVDAEPSQFKRAESELYAKARHSDKDILAKIVEVEEKDDQIVTVTEYRNEETEVFVRSSSKVELYENMPLDDGELLITKVKLLSHEAFYLKQEIGEFPYQSILWIKEYDGEKIMYEVLTYSLDKMTKQQLIEIAEKVDT